MIVLSFTSAEYMFGFARGLTKHGDCHSKLRVFQYKLVLSESVVGGEKRQNRYMNSKAGHEIQYNHLEQVGEDFSRCWSGDWGLVGFVLIKRQIFSAGMVNREKRGSGYSNGKKQIKTFRN